MEGQWQYTPVTSVESEDEILVEVTPGSPLRFVTVEWCADCVLLVRDAYDQYWNVEFASTARVWAKEAE